MAVERGVKLTRPIERGGEKITYVEITGAIEAGWIPAWSVAV